MTKKIGFDDYEQGAEIPELRLGPIQHMDLVKYAGASGDFNPIHTDPKLAVEFGLDGTIAHGMYIMALLGRCATNFVSPTQIARYNVKFKGMTVPGEEVVCSGKVKRKTEKDGKKLITIALQAANGDGEVKVAGDLVINCD